MGKGGYIEQSVKKNDNLLCQVPCGTYLSLPVVHPWAHLVVSVCSKSASSCQPFSTWQIQLCSGVTTATASEQTLWQWNVLDEIEQQLPSPDWERFQSTESFGCFTIACALQFVKICGTIPNTLPSFPSFMLVIMDDNLFF